MVLDSVVHRQRMMNNQVPLVSVVVLRSNYHCYIGCNEMDMDLCMNLNMNNLNQLLVQYYIHFLFHDLPKIDIAFFCQ